MDLDWSALQFLWGVLLVPIGYLSASRKAQKDIIDDLSKRLSVAESKLADMDEKISPLGKDLINLNETILRTELNIEKRLHALTIDSYKNKSKE